MILLGRCSPCGLTTMLRTRKGVPMRSSLTRSFCSGPLPERFGYWICRIATAGSRRFVKVGARCPLIAPIRTSPRMRSELGWLGSTLPMRICNRACGSRSYEPWVFSSVASGPTDHGFRCGLAINTFGMKRIRRMEPAACCWLGLPLGIHPGWRSTRNWRFLRGLRWPPVGS